MLMSFPRNISGISDDDDNDFDECNSDGDNDDDGGEGHSDDDDDDDGDDGHCDNDEYKISKSSDRFDVYTWHALFLDFIGDDENDDDDDYKNAKKIPRCQKYGDAADGDTMPRIIDCFDVFTWQVLDFGE